MDQLTLPARIESPRFDAGAGKSYAASIRQDIEACANALASISKICMEIKAQNAIEGWWKSGTNMRRLADNLAEAAAVQQKTITMVLLLMAAAGRMRSNYGVIMAEIEELSRTHSGSVEALEYLVKVRQTVQSIKKRDDRLKFLWFMVLLSLGMSAAGLLMRMR